MAKITFRKTIIVLFRSKITASLPILGGLFFIIGSIYFWPTLKINGSHDKAVYIGAWWYVVASALYTIAPILDYADMSLALKDALQKKPKELDNAGAFERLYKAQVVRSQRGNALLYAVAGGCFFAGSMLFFPEERLSTTHGAWLYVVGCVLSFLAAFLAASGAYEMKRAAIDAESERAEARPWARASTNPDALSDEKATKNDPTWGRFRKPDPQAAGKTDLESKSTDGDASATATSGSSGGGDEGARKTRLASISNRWSDEDAAILTCALYMIGNVIFAVGSVFYFPRMIIGRYGALYEGKPLLERAAVVLFMVGSLIFTVGASIDFAVLIRAHKPHLIEGSSAQPKSAPTEATSLVGR
jgi:hypothetical protein